MKFHSMLALLTLIGLSACGGKGDGGSHARKLEEIELGDAVDGVYHAHLRPLNPRASGFLPHGGATFRVDGDMLTVKTFLDDDSSVTHRQSVHIGTSCPTGAHDSNRDGFIDYQEALKAVGKVLIPLDGKISNQDEGGDAYPKGSSFTYNESGSLTQMLSDLRAPDKTPGDEFIKLSPTQSMKLVGRVVLIHGTYSNDSLPATLRTRGTDPVNLSLPVVCGVISVVP